VTIKQRRSKGHLAPRNFSKKKEAGTVSLQNEILSHCGKEGKTELMVSPSLAKSGIWEGHPSDHPSPKPRKRKRGKGHAIL